MRSAYAVALRVLRQLAHDPYAVAMVITLPLLAVLVLGVVFNAPAHSPLVLASGVPSDFTSALSAEGVQVEDDDFNDAMLRLSRSDADAYVTLEDETVKVWVEGSDPGATDTVVRAVTAAQAKALVSIELDLQPIELPGGLEIDIARYLPLPDIAVPDPPEIRYVHGSAEFSRLDYHGPAVLGALVFVMGLVTGCAGFSTERTEGTLERVFATPVRSWQIVLGHLCASGVLVSAQTVIVTLGAVYRVGMPSTGGLAVTLLAAIAVALSALLAGILVGTLATTRSQALLLLPVIAVPAVLLSGLIDLSQTPLWLRYASAFLPAMHGIEALRDVMLRGQGMGDVWLRLAALIALAVALFGASVGVHTRRRRSSAGRTAQRPRPSRTPPQA